MPAFLAVQHPMCVLISRASITKWKTPGTILWSKMYYFILYTVPIAAIIITKRNNEKQQCEYLYLFVSAYIVCLPEIDYFVLKIDICTFHRLSMSKKLYSKIKFDCILLG